MGQHNIQQIDDWEERLIEIIQTHHGSKEDLAFQIVLADFRRSLHTSKHKLTFDLILNEQGILLGK